MGRPPVHWTASRKRKLVRLYLATDMHLEDICTALRDERGQFLPEPRKTQGILKELLQPNYERFRPKDNNGKKIHGKRQPFANAKRSATMKTRVGELRQCRAIRIAKSSSNYANKKPLSFDEESRAHEVNLELAIPFDELPFLKPNGEPFDFISDTQPDVGEISTYSYVNTTLESGIYDTADSSNHLPNALNHLSRPNGKRPASSEIAYSRSKAARRLSPDTLSSISIDELENTSTRYDGRELSNLISRESLLAGLCWKYSPSYIADVLSLRSRFSSICSWRSRTSSKVFSITSQEITSTAEISSSQPSCRCQTQPCLHDELDQAIIACAANNLKPSQAPQLNGIDVMATDPLLNGPLHIAAQAAAPLPVFEALINAGSDIHALNARGETFLHILDPNYNSRKPWLLDSLFVLLAELRFDFTARDYHGSSIVLSLLRKASSKSSDVSRFFECLVNHRDLWLVSLWRERTGLNAQTYLDRRCEFESRNGPWDLTYERSQTLTEASRSCTWMFGFENPELLSTVALSARESLSSPFGILQASIVWDENKPNTLHDVTRSASWSDGPYEVTLDQIQERIHQLLKAGFDIDAYDELGYTPLMQVILQDRADEDGKNTATIVEYLISKGSSIHRLDRQGLSLLHMAAERCLITVTEMLIQKGARINAIDDKGRSVLKIAYSALPGKFKMLIATKIEKCRYAPILTCITLLIDHGAVVYPSEEQRWAKFRRATAPCPRF